MMEAVAGRPDDRRGLIRGLRGLLLAGAVGFAVLAAVQPRTAIVGLIVLAVGTVCAIRADIALLILIAVIPLESQFDAVPLIGMTPTKAAGALCFLSFGFYTLRSGLRLVFDASHALVLMLLALALVSTLHAQELEPALDATLRYASFVALYFVASQFVGDQVLHRRMAWTLSISASVAALIALNHFFNTPGYTYRANLAFGDPNDLAFLLATTLPITLWLLRERWALRPLVLGMIVLISLATAFTYSRGALVGIGAGIAFLMLTERKRIPLLIVAGVLTVAAGFLFVQSNPNTVLRVEDALRAKEQIASYNVETRLQAWDAAVTLAVENPLVGIGPGNFIYHYGNVAGIPPGAEPIAVVHNSYLDVASELGLVGLALFFAYLALVFYRLTAAVRSGSGLPGFASALRVSFVITLAAGITISEQYSAPYWLIGGLATALWLESRVATGRVASIGLRGAPGWTSSS